MSINCIDAIMISSKSWSKYVQDIDGIIDRLSKPDLANYKNWNIDTIIIWIRGLENGRYIKHIDLLRTGFNQDQINGKHLPELTRSDLSISPFNMNNFEDKRDLEKHFKSLKSPLNNEQVTGADEGVPTAFIQ